jgi:hypothetical protein
VDDNTNLTFLFLVHQFPEPDMQLAPSEGVRDDIAQHEKDETGKSYMVWWNRREVGRGLSSMPPTGTSAGIPSSHRPGILPSGIPTGKYSK